MLSKMLTNVENVKKGRVKLETIVEERLTLLKKCRDYNAIVAYDEGKILHEARMIDKKIKCSQNLGRLCGAVLTIKDNLEVKGLPATGGMLKYKNNICSEDCAIVSKLRNEGAIILGKTNMPAGAMDIQTFNSIYGRTKHPDFPAYTCGGSSGGGATAIKLGISDADIGNDFMGSIRIPAHFCGIYGIIGTDKVIPYENIVGGKPYGNTMSAVLRLGIQASTLQDLSLLFDLLCKKDMLFPATFDEKSLKIAFTENSEGLPLSKDYEKVYKEFINSLGKKFEVKKIDSKQFDFSKARICFLKLLYGNMSISIPPIARILMRSKMSSKLKDYLMAEEVREQLLQQLDSLFAKFDVLISPVTATPAFKHLLPLKSIGYQSIYTDMTINGEKVSYSKANMGFTTPFSLTASPVIVIPIGKTEAGLPLGVQLVGNRFHDFNLERIAESIIFSAV
ncbi:amidase [Clostridium oryzae]|uniref:Acylamidase n=1 Tax=Clostridium oryzae TaxID=1450648 RepID=A0A1V4IIG9_9CLOT|nr:amidase [Clostridium oryzae]OPJ59726.1 acylamidase [Clostridium oryzae]